jgi:hypothetical protein
VDTLQCCMLYHSCNVEGLKCLEMEFLEILRKAIIGVNCASLGLRWLLDRD